VNITLHKTRNTHFVSNKNLTAPTHIAPPSTRGNEKMSTILNTALEQLATDDAVLQTYRGMYEDVEGTLILSKHALLFLHEQGWRPKNYQLLLNVPYEHLTSVTVAASHRLEFTTIDETFHVVTLDIEAKFIEDTINHCIETLRLKDQIKTIAVPRKKRRSQKSKK